MASRSHPLYSAKSSIRRCEQHLENFLKLEREFLATRPFKMHERRENGYLLHVLKADGGIPVALEDEVNEFFTLARSAMDQAVFAFGGDSFPITKDKKSFEKALNGKRKSRHGEHRELPDGFVDIIREFKPYKPISGKEGNLLPWLIGEFANESKHRKVVPVPPQVTRVHTRRIEFNGGGVGSVDLGMRGTWDFEKEEMIINRISEGQIANFERLELSVDISLGLTTPNLNAPWPTQHVANLLWVADGVVTSFERKALELGLI